MLTRGLTALGEAGFGLGPEANGDLFDFLRGGCDLALAGDADQTSEAGIAVPMQLLGVGERIARRSPCDAGR